jgi:uncharacterized protein (UPF0332 family)
MNETLKNWAEQGWLTEYKSQPSEIRKHLEMAERDLNQAETKGLMSDWRFNIAFSSIISTATAALMASGYRGSRVAHNYYAILSLKFTVGLDESFLDQLDSYRIKRNRATYDESGVVSDREAVEIIEAARRLLSLTRKWLAQNYLHLEGG